MDWLRRTGRSPPLEDEPPPVEPVPEYIESNAPGIATLLKGVSEDGTHAVLDLGAASPLSLQFHSRFARWIRFVDLFGDGTGPQSHESAIGLKIELPQPVQPYDLVFAWDVLDRLFPDDRPRLVEWLAGLTAPDVRLHMIVRRTEVDLPHPLRFTVLDVNRIRYEPISRAQLPRPRIKPAEVGRLIAPLRVLHAYTLKAGLHEYVAVRSQARSDLFE